MHRKSCLIPILEIFGLLEELYIEASVAFLKSEMVTESHKVSFFFSDQYDYSYSYHYYRSCVRDRPVLHRGYWV